MTYDEIRDELCSMRGQPTQENYRRARTLLGQLMQMGISPRRVHLNLRALGLSPRHVQGKPRRFSAPTNSKRSRA